MGKKSIFLPYYPQNACDDAVQGKNVFIYLFIFDSLNIF